MAFCANCGNPITDDQKICPRCGAPMGAIMEQLRSMPGGVGNEADNRKEFGADTKEKKKKMNPLPGIFCFLAAIGLFFSDPPIVTIAGSILVLVLCIIFLAKRIKVCGFPITAIVIVSICLLLTLPDVLAGRKTLLDMPETGYSARNAAFTDIEQAGVWFKLDNRYAFYDKGSSGNMNFEEYSSRNSGIIFMTAVNSKYTDKYISNTGNDSVIDNELQTLLEGCGFGLVQKTNGFRERIAGCSARTIECTAQRKGEKLYLYCTVFANQSKCLISTFFCKDGEEGKYRETFDYMLENAYLKKGSSSSGSSSSGSSSLGSSSSGSSSSGSSSLGSSSSGSSSLGSSSSGSSTSSGSTTEGVSSELKAFLDAYEDFVDEYVSFMKKYSNGSADSLSMLGDYLNMVEKLADYSSKLSEFETENMSAADYAYYLEVTLRCTEKMLEAAY